MSWRPPKLDKTEIATIKSDPSAQRLAARFVAYELPLSSKHYDSQQLLSWLSPFEFDLAKAFLKGCEIVADEASYLINASVVVECALAADAPPYHIVFAHFEHLEKKIEKAQRDRTTEERPWQGELDYAHQLHLQDQLEEEGSAVSHAVEGYVRARRREEGFAWIPAHERLDLIVPAWAEVLLHSGPDVTIAELDTFFALAPTGFCRDRGLSVIGQRAVHDATPYLLSALRIGSSRERSTAVHALRQLKNADDVWTAIAEAMADIDPGNQVDLLLACVDRSIVKSERYRTLRLLRRRAPSLSRDVLGLAILIKIEAPPERLLQAFRRLPPAQAGALIEGPARGFGRVLLSLSAHEGRDITRVTNLWLGSDDDADVQSAIDALNRLGTADARAQIVRALDHKDYQVRRLAMETLARDADPPTVGRILECATDASAPVRKALAELISEQQWPSALPTLLSLLHDRRDFDRHPEYNARPEPQFEVARAAAQALRQFGELPANVVDALIEFVLTKSDASEDIGLHAMLIEILADIDDSRIGPLCSELLSDARVIGDRDENLYPVRYRAGWALFHHLNAYPHRRDAIDWSSVERAAGHLDAQLAAPTLCLLGQRLDDPRPAALALLRSPETTLVRRAVAVLMVEDPTDARTISDRYRLLPADHPLLVNGPTTGDSLPDHATWPTTPTLESWLRALDSERDVEGVLLKIAAWRTGLDLGVADFDSTALRRKPKTPVLSVSEMFGME